MFRDEAVLQALAGRGGDGCSSMRREKYVAFGGPDGGDGGDGGDVYLQAAVNQSSLFAISRQRVARAGNGRPGEGNHRSGRRGENVEVPVPVGTQVLDFEHGNLLADLDREGARLLLARGGKGGRGNARFASATNQAPRHFEKGKDGEQRKVRLVLKLVADLGLVGLPNAGKSTLLRRLTAAQPKVADYPFTTLDPNLGIWELGAPLESLVLADIPGLIEGASEGKGLGHQFLRHVERTRMLLHLVDCSAEAEDPIADWQVIRGELEAYSPVLAQRPWLLLATKVEDQAGHDRALALQEAAGVPVLAISSVVGTGLEGLKLKVLQAWNSLLEREENGSSARL
ncbi:MAG: GTPase ObgE [Planctomycetota bacterium]|nr:MAG: GTPase ObgE [Planctomycetota bacterium]